MIFIVRSRYINYLGCDKWGYSSPLPDPNDPTKVVECTDSNGGSVGAIVYFFSFIVVTSFIVLSLFIGVITSSMMDARSDSMRKSLEAKLREQLEKVFPVWLAFDDEGNARRARFKKIFNVIDDDESGFIVLDELSDWLTAQRVPWSKERRAALLEGLVVPRDDPVIRDELNLSQFIRLQKATELGKTPKELQHQIAITEGRLRVRMHWRPKPPLLMQLDVVVAECEGLANVEQFLCFTGENDPYVRVTANGVNKQTDFIDGGGANPKWNTDGQDGSLLPFAVSELPDAIWVRVFDQDEGSADDLIGIGKIDLSGKPRDTQWFLDDHWVQLYDTYDTNEDKKGKQSGRVKVKVKFDPTERPDAKATVAAGPAATAEAANAERKTRTINRDGDEELGMFQFTILAGKNLTPQVSPFLKHHLESWNRPHTGRW